jgi:hypothetical protein
MNLGPESIVAILAMIVTGLVSILTGFVPVILDWRKSVRDREALEMSRIDQAMLELLGELSNFRHWVADDIEVAAECPLVAAYTKLQVKHYAWERAIWPRLSDEHREYARKLRREFEGLHEPDGIANRERGSEHLSELSERILSITYIAQGINK